MATFQDSLRRVLADRHSPEAAALFQTLLKYIDRRAGWVARTRCQGLLGPADHEELVGEVLYQLMGGAIFRFRGESLGELFAFVRTMTDRIVLRAAGRRLKERAIVEGLAADTSDRWSAARATDAGVEVDVESPLPAEDQAYLVALLQAGSKAELARAAGVSRAAVTQRIGRIHARLQTMSPRDRASHEAWLEQRASDVLADGLPS